MYPGVFSLVYFSAYISNTVYCLLFFFFFGKIWDLTLCFDRCPIFLDYLYYLLSLGKQHWFKWLYKIHF